MTKIKAGISLVIVAIVIIFAIQNAATVEATFLFWSLSVPRVILFAAFLLVGFLLGIIVSGFSKLKGD